MELSLVQILVMSLDYLMESHWQNNWGSGWSIIGLLVGLERGCNNYNRVGLVYSKVVGPFFDILMELEMTWIWRFLIYSADSLVCTNGYYFGK